MHRIAFLLVILLLVPLQAVAVSTAEVRDETGVQDPPPGQETGEQDESDETDDEAEEDPVPQTFDPLLEEFRTLVGRIREAGGNPNLRSLEIRELRQKVGRYHEKRIPDELSLAVELQLLDWVNEFGAPRDALFERFEGAEIRHPGLRISWVEHLARKYRYEDALEVLEDTEYDLERFPAAAIVRAECLITLNRFDEADAALRAIPESARQKPRILDDIYRTRQQLESLREGWDEEQAARDADALADDLPRVEFITEKGGFTVELFEDLAPNTVANFISLVERGFYDGLRFHQVSANLMAVTGDPTTRIDDGTFNELVDDVSYRIRDEIPEEGARLHWSGHLSMVNPAGSHSGSTQFRIALRRLAYMDGQVTVFGRVIDGMRVVRNLERNDRILGTQVLRRRDHDYHFEKIGPEETPPADPPVDEDEDDEEDDGEDDGSA